MAGLPFYDLGPLPKKTNAQKVYLDLIASGLKPGAAAGVVGNLVAESNVDPAAVQKNGPGRGIAQWSAGGRWDQLVAWAKGQNLDPQTLEAQERYLVTELKSGGLWGQLKNLDDPLAASRLVMRQYERPADQSEANAQKRATLGVTATRDVTGQGQLIADDPIGWLKDKLIPDWQQPVEHLVIKGLFVGLGATLIGVGTVKAARP